ncbi:NHL repeat-containing protein [bacterium]|nr:NHL repeat-containing protein [bacterium]
MGATAAQARLGFQYAGQLEISRGSDGALRPVSVTCDPVSQEIVVTDARQMGIHIFNPARVEVFRTSGFAALVGPVDASLDAAGRTVFLQRLAGRAHAVRRLDLYGEPDGFTAAAPTAEFDPEHLLVTHDGHYLTLDSNSGLLVKNDADTGVVLWSRNLGGEATGNNGLMLFGRPAEAPDGRIIVPGGATHVILVLDAHGAIQTAFGRFGSSPGRLVFPVGAAFGPHGELLVLDRMRHKVLVFDGTDYEFQSEFGAQGSSPGQFYHPVALASSADGRLFVAQGFQGRVQVFNILADEDH